MANKNATFSKKTFDAVIRENLEAVIGFNAFGYVTEHRSIYPNYYTADAFAKFKEEMFRKRPDAYTAYNDGAGQELGNKKDCGQTPPKMASVASSSRFCYLAFADDPDITFECDCPIEGVSHAAAQLDAFSAVKNCFIEVKCHEIFDEHEIVMSGAYADWLYDRDDGFHIPGKSPENRKEKIRLPRTLFGLNQDHSMFDVKQFLCHLLAIASKKPDGAELQYLFFKPVTSGPCQADLDSVFLALKDQIFKVFSSAPIAGFCRRHQIALSAIAEEEKVMCALSGAKQLILYP